MDDLTLETLIEIYKTNNILFFNDIQHIITKEKLLEMLNEKESKEQFGVYWNEIIDYVNYFDVEDFLLVSQFDLKFSLEMGMELQFIYTPLVFEEDETIEDFIEELFFEK